jgi:hypothetical protein
VGLLLLTWSGWEGPSPPSAAGTRPEQRGGPRRRGSLAELDAGPAAPGPLGSWTAGMAAWAARQSDLGAQAYGHRLSPGPTLVSPLYGVLATFVVVCGGARLMAGLVRLSSSSLHGAGYGGGAR